LAARKYSAGEWIAGIVFYGIVLGSLALYALGSFLGWGETDAGQDDVPAFVVNSSDSGGDFNPGGYNPAPGPEPAARTGAVCMDGSLSAATGSGACSHHGGVAYWR
jgi:hypothetical protein